MNNGAGGHVCAHEFGAIGLLGGHGGEGLAAALARHDHALIPCVDGPWGSRCIWKLA
jgi:hypothetical protein